MNLPSISFSHPGYLALLALIPLAWITGRRSMADLAPGRARTALALRAAVLALLALALAGVQVVRPSKQLAALFVLDRSYSIPQARRDAEVAFVNSAARLLTPNDRAGVLVFGRDAYLELEPEARLRLGEIHSLPAGDQREYTDVSSAIRMALAAFPDDAQKRIVLLSDGNENLGDAAREAASAASSGTEIDVVPITYEYGREVLLDKMVVPSEAKVGEPIEVRLVAVATRPTTATVTLLHNGVVVPPRKTLALKAGKNPISFTVTLEKTDFHTFQAIIETPPGADSLPENNLALGFTYIRGKPRVLLVDNDRQAARFLEAALKAQKLDVSVAGASHLPATLGEFQAYDSIILSNVGAEQVTPEQMKMIRSNVRDLGAGFIMIGGDRSFGPGAYRGTPIEEVLPVDMEVKKQKVMPTGAVAMVLHTCEFPDGNRVARETAAQVVDVMGEHDKVGVLLYDGQNRWGVPMQEASNKDRIKREIYGLDPSDMPDFHEIISRAYLGLKNTDAAVKHVIVISDGDPQAPSAELLKAMAADRITISTIAVYPHGVGTQTMELMAKATGGQFYEVKSPDEIPRIFLKEAQRVLKPAIIEKPFVPRVDPRSELLPGLDRPPPLLGYVATSPKEVAGVEVPMQSDTGDPVLAYWRYGLGKAVAFTSDARNRWGAAWIASWGGNFSRFWAQVVRWTLRSSARADFQTTVEIQKRRGHVVADVLDNQGEFVNQLAIRGSVASENRNMNLVIDQVAPGRYEGTFDAPEKGQYMISLAYRDAEGIQRIHTVGTAIAYSPEYHDLKANMPLLVRLAEASGGRLYPPLGDPALPEAARALYRHDRQATTSPLDLWPALLLAAMLLFPLDIAVRRVMVSPAEVWDWVRRGWTAVADHLGLGRAPALEPARDPAHARLLAVKEAALSGRAPAAVVEEQDLREPRGGADRPAGPAPAVASPAAVSLAATGEGAESATRAARRPAASPGPPAGAGPKGGRPGEAAEAASRPEEGVRPAPASEPAPVSLAARLRGVRSQPAAAGKAPPGGLRQPAGEPRPATPPGSGAAADEVAGTPTSTPTSAPEDVTRRLLDAKRRARKEP